MPIGRKIPPHAKEPGKIIAKMTPDQLEQANEIIYNAMVPYRGQADKLEAAIGALFLGYQLGWRALYIIHNKRTIKQFEDILGITFRDFFPEEGPASQRSMGYKVAKKLEKYWHVVNGTEKVEHKRELSN